MTADSGVTGPLVTVAIPFLNAERTLADAIRSVFAQSVDRWILLLIDDGSNDKSIGIARAVDDPRVTVISDGQNKGLAGRLNEATALATTPFIARMDADDLMSPCRFERQLELLTQQTEIDVLGTGLYSVLDDGKLVDKRGQDRDHIDERLLLRRRGIAHATVMARRSWCQRNPYDEALRSAEDFDLWLRAVALGDLRAATIASPLYVYREEGNITATKLLRAYSAERQIHIKYSRGWRRRYRVFSTYAKASAVRGLSTIHKEHVLSVLRRGGAITEVDLQSYADVLSTVRETIVPGLDA